MNTDVRAATPDESQMVLAVFDDRRQAEHAVQELSRRGFANDQLSVLARQNDVDVSPERLEQIDREADSVGTDVAVGSTVGGLAGLLGGLALFSIPGLGPFLGTGVLVSTLGGAAVGSVVGERWAHSHFQSLGVPQDRSERYGTALEGGGVIVAVAAHNADDVMRAREVLAMQQADEIDVYPRRHTSA